MNFDFERFYQSNPDPWQFATSTYERGRYRTTVESLPRSTYTRAFEPGCSVGELTAELARICEHVVATDIAPSAVKSARARCFGMPNVDISCGDGPADVPQGPFDLIVFSEIGYYFPVERLTEIAASLAGRLCRGGDFVAVHWLGSSPDHVLNGDEVHEELILGLPLVWLGGDRHPGFRIDSWRQS
jgi:SAM-dependent methyltransferase